MTWIFTTLVIAILSVARTARLVVFDDYPPAAKARDWFDRKTDYNPGSAAPQWGKLVHCAFCAAPYLMLGMAIWTLSVQPWESPFDTWSADWWWMVVNGVWGLSYVASIIVAYDQPEG